MGTKRKTITITDNQDNWIKSQINAGGFTNDRPLDICNPARCAA